MGPQISASDGQTLRRSRKAAAAAIRSTFGVHRFAQSAYASATQDLLVPDELGYVPASKAEAELLFDITSTAYERQSLILTTNLPFEN